MTRASDCLPLEWCEDEFIIRNFFIIIISWSCWLKGY
jgi:hypothetical protein